MLEAIKTTSNIILYFAQSGIYGHYEYDIWNNRSFGKFPCSSG